MRRFRTLALLALAIPKTAAASVPDACSTGAFSSAQNASVSMQVCGTSFAPGASVIYGHAGDGVAEAQSGYGETGNAYAFNTFSFSFYVPPSITGGEFFCVPHVLTIRVEGTYSPDGESDADAGFYLSSTQRLEIGTWQRGGCTTANAIVSDTVYARANAPSSNYTSYRRIWIESISYDPSIGAFLMAGGRFGDAIAVPETDLGTGILFGFTTLIWARRR